jgi:hypothetical protein
MFTRSQVTSKGSCVELYHAANIAQHLQVPHLQVHNFLVHVVFADLVDTRNRWENKFTEGAKLSTRETRHGGVGDSSRSVTCGLVTFHIGGIP